MKKWLIIFDIDNTIVYFDFSLKMPIIRPFVKKFIREFENECEFGIWTLGSKNYASMISKIFDVNWLFVWDRNFCVDGKKLLCKVTYKFPMFDQLNTIFIDDCESNFELNHGWNCILVSPYIGQEKDDVFDQLIVKVRSDLLDSKIIDNYFGTIVMWEKNTKIF